MYVASLQDPDYSVEIEVDHPEFKKLAFTSPGPKNAFAPLQRSGYGRQHNAGTDEGEDGVGEGKDEHSGVVSTTASEGQFQMCTQIPLSSFLAPLQSFLRSICIIIWWLL